LCPLCLELKRKKETKSIGRITPTGTIQNLPAKESNKSKQPDVFLKRKQPDVEKARASPTN
jgi:hypothetical protein